MDRDSGEERSLPFLSPRLPSRTLRLAVLVFLATVLLASAARAQQPPLPTPGQELRTTEEWNKRLQELLRQSQPVRLASAPEYRIGPEDLVEISVFEAPDLSRSVRVSAGGEISLPLLGAVQAAGLTPRELELVLAELLRRAYMKDPHVSVFVREMQSHPVSVFGAVKKPGVFQIRGTKTLIEMLSMAEGLADDAGDTVILMRGGALASGQQEKNDAGPEANTTPAAPTLEVNLKELLESGDPRHNLPVSPGDIIKVTRAGIVYVVGDVKRPGGFVLKSNENISVLQALALAEGLARTAAKSQARIIRTDEKTGERTEIGLNLKRILAGKASDPLLRPKDIVFVPNSAARSGLYRGAEAAISIITGVIIWRR